MQWEHEAEQASAVTRVALVRTGLVLHPDGGALAELLRPFRLGVGGPLGSGRQYMPWIHRDDWVSLVLWIAGAPMARGALNATAPNPVTNREFTSTVSEVMKKPALFPVPAFVLKLIFGEMAKETILASQRAVPGVLASAGFEFIRPTIRQALSS